MFGKLKNRIIRLFFSYLLNDNVKCAKLLGVSIGNNCKILDDPGAVFGSEPWLVTIGNHVEITNGVRFITHEGALWCLRFLYKDLHDCDIFSPVHIGNNVMIGMCSIIMPGVKIGDNVIIGANSVVTKDIPSNSVVAGIPVKTICSMEDYYVKICNSSDLFHTKHMKQSKKHEFLKSERPYWFN